MAFFRPIVESITRLFLLVRAVFRHVFGSISWQAPAWLRFIGSTFRSGETRVVAWVRNNRRLARTAGIVFIAFAGAVTGAVLWNNHLPKTVEGEIRGQAPSLNN